MPRALILGVGGQDGAYLARLLIARGFAVSGTTRGSDLARLSELQIADDVRIWPDDDIGAMIAAAAPEQIFDLRGPALGEPVDAAELTARTHSLIAASTGVRLLIAGAGDDAAFAGPFATAKTAVARLVTAARGDGRFVVTAHLSEHESRLSHRSTAARLISGVQAIARSTADTLAFDAAAVHDWGWAPEYVDALARMLAAPAPADHAVASGSAMTEHDFATAACGYFGVDPTVCGPAPATGAVRAAPVAPPVPGWRAFTTGTDLVETLCEGAAA